MRVYVLWFWFWCIIYISTNIKRIVILFIADFRYIYQSRIARNFIFILECRGNFLNIFWSKCILLFALFIFIVSIDYKHLIFKIVRLLFAKYHNTGWNASTIKQLLWQSNYAFQYIS